MTYNEIVKMALTHLEYGTDDDAVAPFFDRFMMYANEAVRIIANDIKMDFVDEFDLDDGCTFTIQKDGFAVKVVEVFTEDDKGRKTLYPFVRDEFPGKIRVLGRKPGDLVQVRGRCVPNAVTDGDAEPSIPDIFHPIIYLYIVHCYHNTRSTSSDYDRTKWLQQFNTEKKKLVRWAYGALDTYQIKNKPWQTGEM